jgi:hypothetical protein
MLSKSKAQARSARSNNRICPYALANIIDCGLNGLRITHEIRLQKALPEPQFFMQGVVRASSIRKRNGTSCHGLLEVALLEPTATQEQIRGERRVRGVKQPLGRGSRLGEAAEPPQRRSVHRLGCHAYYFQSPIRTNGAQ